MKKAIAFFILAAVVFYALPLNARQPVQIASLPWGPYANPHLPEKGFANAIISTAFAKKGISPRFIFCPWKRGLRMVEKGTVLAAAHAYYTKERATRFLFSEPYLDSKIVLCVLKGSPIKWSGSLKELEGFRIGVVSGFSNTPEFDSDSHLTKDYATNDLYNLKKLIKKRVDVIVIDKYVAIDILKNNPTVDKGLGAVEFLNPELAVRPLHLIFNQTKPKAVELLKNFNEGLRIATEDGSIKEIMQQFE